MRSCLAAITAFGLLVALVCPTAMADQGGVVRIHFSNSLQPDLTEIVDAYHGSGIIRAHVVIESIPGCLVSGYQLGYELVSEDSLVVMVGGFHPSRGWELLGSDEEFPEISGRAAKVPVSVGYWNLWLREGRASLGYIRLRPVEIDGVERILLLDRSHKQIDAIRAYGGGINGDPPPVAEPLRLLRLTRYSGEWKRRGFICPTWPPDGRSIAMIQGNGMGIWKICSDGTGLERLTSDRTPTHGFAWSPDSRYIAYLAEKTVEGERYFAIKVIDTEDKEVRQITDFEGFLRAPQWISEDGTIAFQADRNGTLGQAHGADLAVSLIRREPVAMVASTSTESPDLCLPT